MKIILLVTLLLLGVILGNQKIEAQSTYNDLVKSYCDVEAQNTAYAFDSTIALSKATNSLDQDVKIKIDKVTVSGAGQSKSFDLGTLLTPSQLTGGAKILVPGLDNFVKQTAGSQAVNFDVTIDKTISNDSGEFDPTKPDKNITSKKCWSVTTEQALQLAQQAQPKPQPQPQPAQPGAAPGGGSGTATNPYCNGNAADGVDTAIGCIPILKTEDTVEWFLRWVIGISGGIAFLLMAWSAIQMMSAGGDPAKMQAAREVLTAAISGLVFIIFSVFLLNLIGYQIFKLPGF